MRVYVETNFLVDLLRPFARKEAERLWQRHLSGSLRLTVPWCSLNEAERTLDKIVKEDLGFSDNLGRFKARLVSNRGGTFSGGELKVLDRVMDELRTQRSAALAGIKGSIQAFSGRVDVVHPTARTSQLAVSLNREKRLKPFDEMTLACVLADAELRVASGENNLFFCDKDGDLQASDDNGLGGEYSNRGIVFVRGFAIP